MTHVATLIAHPDCPWLDDPHAARARALLANPGKPDWLDPGIAVDLPFAPAGAVDARALANAIRAELDPTQCDVVVQEVAHRRKRLLVADMDSTMIGQECIDELAACVGLKEHVAAITERAMRGEIEFEPALRERVGLLKGLPASVVEEVIATRITFTRGGAALVRTMRAHGAHTALVSGGFTLFTGPIAAAIGFHENRANRLIVEDGAFVGRVDEPILGRQAKLDALRELRATHGIEARATLAVGDGANDLAMLGEAGLGVAYRAKPAVAAAAHARLDYADLTGLLYAQGYRPGEFAG
jgi:phosphoserine phosphatase